MLGRKDTLSKFLLALLLVGTVVSQGPNCLKYDSEGNCISHGNLRNLQNSADTGYTTDDDPFAEDSPPSNPPTKPASQS